MPLEGQSLVVHAARNLLAARAAGDDRVRVLVVTAPAFHLDAIAGELAGLTDQVTLLVVAGGATRQASVAAGLAALDADRGLSAGEKRMLAKARQILVSELALAEHTEEEKAEAILDEVLAS